MPIDPARRHFVTLLAGSPLLAALGLDRRALERLIAGAARPHEAPLTIAQQAIEAAGASGARMQPTLIKAASEALDVFDFEPVAQQTLPPAHWGYLATGTDDDATIRANRAGYERWALRPRRLIDVGAVDASVSFLGTRYPTPIVINPVGSQKAFHAQGEVAVARAAKARNHLMVLSTVATTSIEEAIAERGGPVWFQLYHQTDWSITKQMIARAERAGAPAIVFTVDLLGGSNRLTMTREARRDTRECTRCHLGGAPLPGVSGRVDDRDNRRKPNLVGYDTTRRQLDTGTPTWAYVDRIRQATKAKVWLKGIVTEEDAALAVKHGVDGVFVSNHGGRAENSGRATVTSLPEVVRGAAGKLDIICDGGVRRGVDAFKALALGAKGVGIGRPYIWGLASFGQEGVETVLALLRKELEVTMKQCGATSLAQIGRRHITTA
ncbi:MAG: alpha-hydroxy-acid oxidizing protein [Gemmatimonadetes bacterium]|nr:alpha-hydroxy-acid oxidizing protein [Gemmatimonadota bacterium]